MAAKTTINVTGEPSTRRKFQQTKLGTNNNKWYLVEVWPAAGGLLDFRATYGRVGGTPAKDEKPGVTQAWVDAKIREKLRGGYVEVQLAQVAPTGAPVAALVRTNDPVDRLVARVFREAGEQIKTYLAVAVDALGQAQIAQGRQLLQDAQTAWATFQASQAARTSSQADLLLDVVQRYYNAVPTQLPHKIDPWQVVTDFCKDFSEQETRLQQLEAAIATQAAATGETSQLSALGCKLALVDPANPIWQQISRFVTSTASRYHGYTPRPQAIYEVEIPAERAAYLASPIGKSHRELLFHGTAAGNIRHILRSGLIVPRTASNGRAFGDGIYFAKDSTKSVNYCSARHGGKILFLGEVAIGRAMTPRSNAEVRTARSAPAGYDSVWAKVGQTAVLQHDEIIVYRTEQQTLRYVVELA